MVGKKTFAAGAAQKAPVRRAGDTCAAGGKWGLNSLPRLGHSPMGVPKIAVMKGVFSPVLAEPVLPNS